MSLAELCPLTLPLHGIRLIEASAGTGKTWTIAALYLRLILGHRENDFGTPLTPDQILVVTFTEAATSELRDRIRTRLTEAAHALSGPVSALADPFLQELTQGVDDLERQTLVHRLTVAADAMDEAAVFTIHGWCSRMLRQHAFDSGSPFELRIEGDETALRHESVRDFWRSFIYPLPSEAFSWIARSAASPEALLLKLRSLLNESDQSLAPLRVHAVDDPTAFSFALSSLTALDNQCKTLEQTARDRWSEARPQLETLIREVAAGGALDGRFYPHLEARLDQFRVWSEGGLAKLTPTWIRLFSKNGFKIKKSARRVEPEHPAFESLARWSEGLESLNAAALALEAQLLCTACFWVRRHFAEAKTKQARLDYNDLIHHLHHALVRTESPRLKEIIRHQYPVALIDEFQDTDPEQYELFDALYGQSGTPTAWLMVGDPKQAIYGFRGADVFAYLRARHKNAGENGPSTLYTLPCNYRSSTALVEAINRLFQTAESDFPLGAFRFRKTHGERDRIPFAPVRAKGRSDMLWVDGQKAPALTFCFDAHGHQAMPKQRYQAVMANACALEITALLHQAASGPPRAYFESVGGGVTPVEPGDIAILVRDGSEARAIRAALAQCGLRSVYLSDRDSVFGSREARDLVLWLKAFLDPQSGRRVRAAMATRTLAHPYEKLDLLNQDELALDRCMNEFAAQGERWRRQGILPAIRAFLLEQQLPSRLSGTATGERVLTNLLHLSELLQNASIEREGQYGLLRFLEESIEADQSDHKETLLRLESDQRLIRVVTIHKAKGLEYPLVFIPFALSYKELNPRNLSAFRFHRLDDPAHPIELILRTGSGDLESAKRQMEDERLQEDLRLFYVAITRAQHLCWLGVAPLKIGSSETPTLHKGALGYLLCGDQETSAAALRSTLESRFSGLEDVRIVDVQPTTCARHLEIPAEVEPLKPDLTFKGAGFRPWWIASYSALKSQRSDEFQSALSPGVREPLTPAEDQALEDGEPGVPAADGVAHSTGNGEGELHAFPAGSAHGVFLHLLLESAANIGLDVLTADPSRQAVLIDGLTAAGPYADWRPTLKAWLPRFLLQSIQAENQTFSLSEITAKDTLTEMEFWFEVRAVWTQELDQRLRHMVLPGHDRPALSPIRLGGILKGFIDLVFRKDGRYYVADYKSNKLGDSAEAYTDEALARAILEKRYDAQYVLYLLALHRYLRSRLGADYDYARDVGGAVYLFLRGVGAASGGIYLDKPAKAEIEALDAWFLTTHTGAAPDAGR